MRIGTIELEVLKHAASHNGYVNPNDLYEVHVTRSYLREAVSKMVTKHLLLVVNNPANFRPIYKLTYKGAKLLDEKGLLVENLFY